MQAHLLSLPTTFLIFTIQQSRAYLQDRKIITEMRITLTLPIRNMCQKLLIGATAPEGQGKGCLEVNFVLCKSLDR